MKRIKSFKESKVDELVKYFTDEKGLNITNEDRLKISEIIDDVYNYSYSYAYSKAFSNGR